MSTALQLNFKHEIITKIQCDEHLNKSYFMYVCTNMWFAICIPSKFGIFSIPRHYDHVISRAVWPGGFTFRGNNLAAGSVSSSLFG